ncbi:MAG TPA: hypothetical protein VHO90_00400 [Bacteroidales bacterium]|nr:hypothetical protein [Bacteroidales bacterium]
MIVFKRNITLLVLFHLAILVSPSVGKLIHHHSFKATHTLISDHATVASHEDRCLICEFDYLPFVPGESPHDSVCSTIAFHFHENIIGFLSLSHYNLPLLRAPPSC